MFFLLYWRRLILKKCFLSSFISIFFPHLKTNMKASKKVVFKTFVVKCYETTFVAKCFWRMTPWLIISLGMLIFFFLESVLRWNDGFLMGKLSISRKNALFMGKHRGFPLRLSPETFFEWKKKWNQHISGGQRWRNFCILDGPS